MPALERIALLTSLLTGLIGCAPAPGSGPLELSLVDDRGEPLAEAAFLVDGKPVARSDAHGGARLAAHQLRDDSQLGAACPEAYRPAPPVRLASGRARPPRLQFVCRPRLRMLAVVAFAPGAQGAPLRADGQVLGRVAADGTLHAVLRRPPGAALTLTLEATPGLIQAVRVRDRDEIVLLDATR